MAELDLSKPHMSREDITKLIGMKPKNLDLYRRAFVHKSIQKYIKNSNFLNNVQDYMKGSFERLEYVGDAVFNLVVAKILYNTFQDKDEGFLTRLRTKIVRGSNCSRLAAHLELGKYILIGSKIKESVAYEKLLEDVFESLIGAIFLDLGYLNAESFITTLVNNVINMQEIVSNDDNYKDIIMRYTQINGYELPIYKLDETIGVIGLPNDRTFTIVLNLSKNGIISEFGIGKGSSKKEAEQNACKDSICFKNLEECNIHTCNSLKIHLDSLKELINRDKIKF